MANKKDKNLDCESQGKITVRMKNGKVYCRSPPKKKKSPNKPKKPTSRKQKDKYVALPEDIEYLNNQTVLGLLSYIKSRDVDKELKGYTRLRKSELIKFIVSNINIDTGKLLR